MKLIIFDTVLFKRTHTKLKIDRLFNLTSATVALSKQGKFKLDTQNFLS